MKLVKPEVVSNSAPTQRGGGGLSARGANSRRCARNNSVLAPTMPATTCASSKRNSKVPSAMPSIAKGSMKRSSLRSKSLRKAASPITSMTNSSGIRMAAACGTGMASAMSGTASEPKPAPKPLLLTPSSKTAGTATA